MTTDVTNLTEFPIPNNDIRVASRNAQDLDSLINGGAGTVTNRAGAALKRYEQIVADIGTITPRGQWATGTAYNAQDIWQHRTTNVWYQVLQGYTSGADEASDIALSSPRRVEVYQSLIRSFPSGTSRPSMVLQYGVWVDITTPTAWEFNLYDGSDDVSLFVINPATNVVTYSNTVSKSSDTGAAILPSGTTAQAPAAASGAARVDITRNEAVIGVGSSYFDVSNYRQGVAATNVDAMTTTFSRPVLSWSDDLTLIVESFGPNVSTTPTINPNGIGAKTLVKNGNQALDPGDTGNAGNKMVLIYSSANDNVELLNPAAGSGADTDLSNLTATGNAKIATAWINFNGTGTVAIRGQYNVSSITDNGTGNYSINLIESLSDTNVATIASSSDGTASGGRDASAWAENTLTLRVVTFNSASHSLEDHSYISLSSFGG